jgi:hypothetical protein
MDIRYVTEDTFFSWENTVSPFYAMENFRFFYVYEIVKQLSYDMYRIIIINISMKFLTMWSAKRITCSYLFSCSLFSDTFSVTQTV